jgi:hypothetical protein
MTSSKLAVDTDTCPRCGRLGIFGYHDREGALICTAASIGSEDFTAMLAASKQSRPKPCARLNEAARIVAGDFEPIILSQ